MRQVNGEGGVVTQTTPPFFMRSFADHAKAQGRMARMSDPDEESRPQPQQDGDATVDDVLDAALAHDRGRESAIDDGNLEELAQDAHDRDTGGNATS